jgi:hypothetical protein
MRSVTNGRAIFLLLVNILRQGAWLFALAGLGFSLILFAIGYSARAGYAMAQRTLSPDLAALAVAVGLLVIAIIVFWVLYRMIRIKPPARSAAVISDDPLALAVQAIVPLLDGLGEGLAKRAPSLVIVSLCSGFIAGVLFLNRRR